MSTLDMIPETLEADTLRLVQLCDDNVDVHELYELFERNTDGTAEVFEYVPQEPYGSIKDAYDRLQKAETEWNDATAAQYAVYTEEGALAGYAGLFMEWERRTGRLGFILGKPYWGRGYAGECAIGLAELAFERLDLELVSIGHEEGNDRSKRAIEKFVEAVGGQYDGVLRNWTPIGDEIASHHRYTIAREDFLRKT